MLTVVYPYQVKSLAEDVDVRSGGRNGKRADWVLDIAGPFCFLAERERYGHTDFIADCVSRFLALPTSRSRDGKAISIHVHVPESEKERLIKREYRRLVKA